MNQLINGVLTHLDEGGLGSGFFGHAGRIGKRGGSLPKILQLGKGKGILLGFPGTRSTSRRGGVLLKGGWKVPDLFSNPPPLHKFSAKLTRMARRAKAKIVDIQTGDFMLDGHIYRDRRGSHWLKVTADSEDALRFSAMPGEAVDIQTGDRLFKLTKKNFGTYRGDEYIKIDNDVRDILQFDVEI